MPITIEWYDANTNILHWQFEGKWTWEEFFDARDTALALIRSKDCHVDTIVDFSNGHLIPRSMIARADLWADHKIVSKGIFVVIAEHLLVRMFYTTLSRTFYKDLLDQKRLFLVNKMQDAIARILEHRREHEFHRELESRRQEESHQHQTEYVDSMM